MYIYVQNKYNAGILRIISDYMYTFSYSMLITITFLCYFLDRVRSFGSISILYYTQSHPIPTTYSEWCQNCSHHTSLQDGDTGNVNDWSKQYQNGLSSSDILFIQSFVKIEQLPRMISMSEF